MAIRTVVTRGYGNGTFSGTIPLAVLRGYGIGEPAVIVSGPFRSASTQSHTPGSVSAQAHTPGSVLGQSHTPGATASQGA